MAKRIVKLFNELDAEYLDILAQGCCDELLSSQLERQHLDLPAFAEAILDSGVKNEEDISNYCEKNVGFFKIDEIVFDADEKIHLPGVESVISSMRNSGFSLIFLVKSTGKETSVYFGVSDFVGHNDSGKKTSALRAYRSAWEAYFPGIKLKEEGIGEFSPLKHIGVLTGIPSLKREESGNLFVQGLERLIRAMRGKEYCWVSIADPIPQDELRHVLSACRSLQADVHRLVKTQFSKSKAKALSQTVGAFGMKGSGESHSKTQNYAEDYQRVAAGASAIGTSLGGMVGAVLGGAIPIPGVGSMLGGMLGSTIGGTVGKMIGGIIDDAGKALTGKTGYSETDTTSSQQAGGAFASVSRSITDTTTLGQEVLNRKAEYAEEVLKAYEERLLDGVAVGMWNLGHYFCASREETYNQGIGVVQSLFSGMESRYEPPRAIKMSGDFAKILSRFRNVYVRFPKFGKKSEFSDHPFGIFFNGPGTPVNTRELAVATPIATQDIEGVTVSKRPSFGININGQDKGESVELADILDKGNPTEQKYHLNLENMPKHLAVFGLTGSGKTNTVHGLIRTLWCEDRKIPFLVIEPAKAEYRELIKVTRVNNPGKFIILKDDLLVFSAGADTTDVCPLRLNPFDFDPGEDCDARRVHVLTHIDRLKATFNASFPMYASMPYILEEAILEIYRDRGWDLGRSQNKYVDIYKDDFRDYIPTLQDLYNKIDPVIKKKGYFKEQEMNIGAALKARISSLMVGAKGTMFNCTRSVPAKDLFSKPVVVELENMGDDDEKAFLMGLLVSRLYEYRKTKFSPESGSAQPKHLLVIEEAHRLLANIPESAGTMETANVKGKAVSAFVDMLAEIRAMGQSVAVVDQLPSRVSSNIVKGTGTKIVHRLLAKDDRESVGETMGLNKEQIDDLCLLRTGECVVSQDGDSKAYMCKVKRNPVHDQRKGGEVSKATKKYKNENAYLFSSPNPEVNLEDFYFKDALHKTMLAVGLGDDAAALLEKVVPAGRYASKWHDNRTAWFGRYWEQVCAEIWALHGGDYSCLLKLKKRGNALLNAFVKENSSEISSEADEYRKAFGEFYRETKAYLNRLTDSDSIGLLAYKYWDLLKTLNTQLPNLKDAKPEERNRRVATGIERALSILAPRKAQLSRELRGLLAGEILDELPVKIPREDVWGYIFGKEENK